MFEAGGLVAAEDTLLRLEDSDYLQAVNAPGNLAAARLTLLEEERQAVQAEAEWRSAGLEVNRIQSWCCGSLCRCCTRQPAQCKAAVASAQKDLDHTYCRAV